MSILPHRTLEIAPSWFPTVLCTAAGTAHKHTNRQRETKREALGTMESGFYTHDKMSEKPQPAAGYIP